MAGITRRSFFTRSVLGAGVLTPRLSRRQESSLVSGTNVSPAGNFPTSRNSSARIGTDEGPAEAVVHGKFSALGPPA